MQTILLHARRFKLSKLLKLSKDKTLELSLLTAEDISFKWDLPQRSIPPINLWKICIDLRSFSKCFRVPFFKDSEVAKVKKLHNLK